MKISTFAFSFLVAGQALAAGVLVELQTVSGFSPQPGSRSIQILTDGKVVSRVNTSREKSLKELAKLSKEGLASLKAQVEAVSADASLVDEDPHAPRCLDAPSSAVSVWKSGKKIVVHRKAMCHRFILEDGSEGTLPELLSGFATLAR